jgi:hypothetical protein
MISLPKLLRLSCLVVMLLATLTPVSAALFWLIVIPVLLVIGATLPEWAECPPQENRLLSLSHLSVLTSRAPPSATR